MLYNLKHSEEILKAKTNSELRSICKDEWDSDGTFDAAPGTLTEMFAQLYVFHGKIDGQKKSSCLLFDGEEGGNRLHRDNTGYN